jgi:carbamate kinase
MRIVVALGGNALIRRGQPLDQEVQQRNVDHAVQALAEIAAAHQLVVTHGNGPQVGLLALMQETSPDARPYTLDVLGSQTQGMIGYMLEEALREALPGREVATLLTQVVVGASDPAFTRPTKPIGRVYDAGTAEALAASRGWVIAPDGDGFRRVVASPEPQRIVEIGAIRLLVESGVIVICAGGGGVPVVIDDQGASYGVEAVVDKDLTAALLAMELAADALILLTDVTAVEEGWGTPAARPIRSATPTSLRSRTFAEGTMGPKVEAACRFVDGTGGWAAIGALEEAMQILGGTAGTRVIKQAEPKIEYWTTA